MDIVHRIGIKAPAAHVYKALATIEGLAGWWTRDTTGNAQPGGHVAFRFHTATGDEIGGFTMGVLEQTPDHKVRWQVEDGPAEWLGTEVLDGSKRVELTRVPVPVEPAERVPH